MTTRIGRAYPDLGALLYTYYSRGNGNTFQCGDPTGLIGCQVASSTAILSHQQFVALEIHFVAVCEFTNERT